MKKHYIIIVNFLITLLKCDTETVLLKNLKFIWIKIKKIILLNYQINYAKM